MMKRKDRPVDNKVSIVQGSGSGHEPAHVMAVGPGMLIGACQGPVFAAPPVDACYETIKALATPMPVCWCWSTTTRATAWRGTWPCEMAQAEGIKVEQFWINDDVAVKDQPLHRRPPRRGRQLLRDEGLRRRCRGRQALEEVMAVAEKVNNNVRTMGVALTSCIPPAKGSPIFEIGDDEMEVGVGIHGEPGRDRAKITSADEITKTLFDAVADDLPFNNGDRVALMVNGLGGTPPAELYVLYNKAAQLCEERGLTVARNYVGEYCTSLEMAGASITMLKLDEELEKYLDAPAHTATRIF